MACLFLTAVIPNYRFWKRYHLLGSPSRGPAPDGPWPGNLRVTNMSHEITIRSAQASDLEAIIALDEGSIKEDKPGYWRRIFEHYVIREREDRIFLVAEKRGALVGFIVGEVRAWEFGSPPCGWVFAVTVSPKVRESGIGSRMFDEICRQLKQTGIETVRTMVDLDNRLALSFFRSLGLRTGRYVELEKEID